MSNRGFARGRSAAHQSAFVSTSDRAAGRRRALLAGAALAALAVAMPPPGGSAFAAGIDIGPGQTYDVIGPVTTDYLNIDPTGTLNFGNLITNDLLVNDNGVDTIWSGFITSTPTHVDKDDQYLVKNGNGTVTMQGLSADGTEIHLTNGTIQQLSGDTTLFILNVGSNVPAAGTGTFNISGGTLTFPGALGSPHPVMQVGHFGGTGVVNQTGGEVIFQNASAFNIGNQGGHGTYNLVDGKVTVQGIVGSPTSAVTIGRSTAADRNSTGILNISGGVFEMTNGVIFVLGNNSSGGAASSSQGIINQTGGTIRYLGDGSSQAFYLSGYNNGTYNLLGGALEIGGTALRTNYAGAGVATFNLGGGTIRTIGAILNAGVNATLLADTTSTIDTNGIGTNWNGTLSGPGSLNKAGGGTLTFSTVQAYTGTTFVNGGTLMLAGGADISASNGVNLTGSGAILDVASAPKTIQDLAGVTGSVVNLGNQTLTAGSPRDSIFAGMLQGTGGLTKVGTGTLTLAGPNTYIGATDVNGGTLRFGAGGAIMSTSTLNVTGTASLDLGGAGEQNLTSAPVNFAAGTTYLLSLASGDTLTTGGAATLGGAGVFVRGLGGGFDPAADYTILTATGFTGTFGSIDDDMPFLNATLRPTALTTQDIYFVAGQSFEGTGVTPNQQAIGGAIDNLGLGTSLFDQIAVLGVEQALHILDTLSGEFHASLKSALMEQGGFLGEAVGDRVAQAFAGPSGGGGADYFPEPPPAHRGGAWAQVFGHHINMTEESGNAADVSGHDFGMIGGLDSGMDGWLAGIGGGISRSNLSSEVRLSEGEVSSAHGFGYAGGEVGAVRVHVGGAYSWHAVDTTRTADLPMPQTLTASYGARTAQVFGEASVGIGPIRPFVGAAHLHLSTDGFTETGGDAALTADASSQAVTFTTIGLRAETAAGSATLSGMLGWRHAFGDLTPLSAFEIQGQGFAVTGVPIAADAVVLEAGVDVAVSPGAKLGLSYTGQIANGAQEHGAKGTASVSF